MFCEPASSAQHTKNPHSHECPGHSLSSAQSCRLEVLPWSSSITVCEPVSSVISLAGAARPCIHLQQLALFSCLSLSA